MPIRILFPVTLFLLAVLLGARSSDDEHPAIRTVSPPEPSAIERPAAETGPVPSQDVEIAGRIP